MAEVFRVWLLPAFLSALGKHLGIHSLRGMGRIWRAARKREEVRWEGKSSDCGH
jgi:hypothetical protein